MKRFTHHKESWGVVDAKVNAPALLVQEVKKKEVGRVWISGVCEAKNLIKGSDEPLDRLLLALLFVPFQ